MSYYVILYKIMFFFEFPVACIDERKGKFPIIQVETLDFL